MALYYGTINLGDRLVASAAALTKGKLVSVEETAEVGDFEVVAIAEEIHINEHYIIFRTVSPVMVTIS